MAPDRLAHVPEIAVQDGHRDAGSSRSQIAVKPRRSANSIVTCRRAGATTSLAVGEPLDDIGRHEALELTLQLHQLAVRGRHQLFKLAIALALANNKRGHARKDEGTQRCQ